MRTSLRHNGSEIIEIYEASVNGKKAAGGYGFTLIFQSSHRGFEPPIMIFDIRLTLELLEPRIVIANSILSSNQLITCKNYPSREQIFFEFVLSKEQLNFIEENRQDRDLKLNVWLRNVSFQDGMNTANSDTAEVSILRDHWLKALKDAGFRQTVLFEIPMPDCAGEPEKLIAKAQEFIEVGHYKDAVMQCRCIIEHIEEVRGDKRDSAEANRLAHAKSEQRQQMSAEQRLLSIREQLKNVCQLGAHGSEQFTRSQAKAVLGMTMVLLAEPTVGYSKFLAEEKQRIDEEPEVKEQHQEQAASQLKDEVLAESVPE
ncbi:hypothetical protein [Rheinheimera maricola]|uniref:Uncharacterized protein n=1 Tax=Rheinheimera maricola TaxID=2793282 RepID=A0ABS7XCA5_9GAMM|nr:hypothetical protein [Rheinheimera maricola]MBZ9612690.1 hypothetical protein [Rheinheimera maricola]